MRPPETIDGAKVLEWAWSGERPFGCLNDAKGAGPLIEIFGLAICQYPRSSIYCRFACNRNWETQQDAEYASVEEAREPLPAQYQKVPVCWQVYVAGHDCRTRVRRIDGERVYLRPFTLDDAEKIYRMSIEEGMKKWIPDQVYDDVTHAREVLQYLISQYTPDTTPAQNPLVFGICLKSTGELIGHVGLSPYEGEVEVGFAIEECRQGHGYAAEAVRAMAIWALQEYRLSSVVGIVDSDNRASVRTLEKSGFLFEREEKRRFHGRDTVVRTYRLEVDPHVLKQVVTP